MDGARAALAAGLRALEQARWDQARECLQVVLAHGASAPAHDGLGLALWFLGEVPEAVAERERAFELYAAGGRPDEAARCAVWVSHQHAVGGRASAARGWLARAERVVDGLPADGAGTGGSPSSVPGTRRPGRSAADGRLEPWTWPSVRPTPTWRCSP